MATSPYFSTSNQYIKYDIHCDELSTSIANNTSTVRVYVLVWRTNSGYTTSGTGTCYVSINGTSYSQSISSSQTIYHNSDTVIFDKTVTVPHNSDGTKTIYVSASISHARFSSNSNGFNVTLSTIPRKADITAAPDFNNESNPTISYTNPAGTSATTLQACISLDNSTDTIAYRDIEKTGTSYTFNLSAADRITLLAATPNSNTLTVYFIIKTVLGGTTYYSSVAKVMSVVNANPTITSATYKDTNASTVAITGDDQVIIQSNSTLQFKFATLTAIKSATLANVKVKLDGTTYLLNLSGTTQNNKTISIGTVNSSADLDAEVILTDSRGNTATETVPVTMLSWILPSALISLKRKSNFYSETYLTVNADYSPLDGNNTITIEYQYKETGTGIWSAAVAIQDGVQVTLNMDNTKSYDFKIVVSDLLGTTTYNTELRIGIPILFIDRLRRSVGIGTIPDEDNMFVADRRISLKNPSQELLADLWSWTSPDTLTRSASLYLYDQAGDHLVSLVGRDTGGMLYLYKNGRIVMKNTNDDINIQMAAGNSGDGNVYVYDDSGNVTITLGGQNGTVYCKKVRASEGVVELYDGNFSSGSTTFSSKSNNVLVVAGHVTSSGSTITMTIPVILLSSTARPFCISDESHYISFSLALSNTTITMAIIGKDSTGYIEKVYGVN